MAKTPKTSAPAKKPAPKPKPVVKKPAPPPAKKPSPAPAAKSSGKKAELPPTKTTGKPEPAKAVAGKPGVPPAKTTGKAVVPAPAKSAPLVASKNAIAPNGAKIPPKGITVVAPRPMRKPKPKKLEMPISEPLLKPGGPKWKPLIPSGPKAPPTGLVGAGGPAPVDIASKVRLSRKELDKYREILMHKRAELVGDVSNIEDEALLANSGSLSTLPQHMAEQGSDTFDQSLSLDLAQVDRNLIREIDDALKRIEDGTYGVCLRSGQRISPERLAELPWAKYSIEAQREMERRSYHRPE